MARYNRSTPSRSQPSRTRTTLGLFFNPNFGTSLGMLRDTGRMFIQMIAMIFAQANLIDKRHPAVTGTGKDRYNLLDIVNMAYQRVEWRQDNLAQISMFLGVCAALGICALSLVYMLFAVAFSAV